MADLICPSRICRRCLHLYRVDDESFIVNGWHYYCDAVRFFHRDFGLDYTEDDCIDGFWHEEGQCKLYRGVIS